MVEELPCAPRDTSRWPEDESARIRHVGRAGPAGPAQSTTAIRPPWGPSRWKAADVDTLGPEPSQNRQPKSHLMRPTKATVRPRRADGDVSAHRTGQPHREPGVFDTHEYSTRLLGCGGVLRKFWAVL